jgi:formylglycine-generating enzyme required for sulfatase activity
MSELKSKRVGRGDLLRWAAANRNANGFEAGAVALGFELGEPLEISLPADVSERFRQQSLPLPLDPIARSTPSKIRNIDRDLPSAVIVESVEQLPPAGDVSLIPASQAGDEQWVQLPNDVPMVQSEPLMPWNQLAPKLKRLTSTIAKAGVDLPEFSRLVSLGKVVRSVPSKQRRRQLGRTHLWLDCANHLRPYFPDMASIVFPLIAQRARGEVTVTNIDLPHGQPVNALSGEVLLAPPKVRPGDQVLVLGDANSLLVNAGSNSSGRWVTRALNIRRCGARVQLLHPMPNLRLGEGIRGNFETLPWVAKHTLPWVAKHTLPPTQSALAASPLDDLLMLASPFVRIEPHLLRALRIALVGYADPSLESEFYQHRHVASDCDAAWVLSEHRAAYFELLMQRGTQTLLIKLARLAHHHHRYQRPIIWAEEIGLFAQLAEYLENQTEEASDADTEWFAELANEASKGKQAVARLVFKKGGGQNEAESTVEASISERFAARLIGRKAQLDIVDEADKQFQTVHAASALRRYGTLGALQGFDSALLGELMKGSVHQSPIAILLYQKGRYLIFVRADRSKISEHFGRVLCTFSTSHSIHIEVAGKHAKSLTVESLLPAGDNFSKDCFLQLSIGGKSSTPIKIDAGIERITLRNIVWPVATRSAAALRAKSDIVISAFGVDQQYGTYFDLSIGKSITQRFIWITPGSFNIGSPKNEGGRDDGEGPQHKVVLTQGFWMADTACSQAFWAALMLGNNPSYFKGVAELPVESVCWDDVQKLLEVLGSILTDVGLELVPTLPTQAQWEYACRAGTEGPFNTGSTITSGHANIDGRRPYRDGDGRGTFRKSTVPVKSFEPNNWGLYQMHGNVWEWCDDDRRKYTTKPVTNPGDRFVVPKAGLKKADDSRRAVCGGSWSNGGRDVRSASRLSLGRSDRGQDLGIRLVLRLKGPYLVDKLTRERGKLTESNREFERLSIRAQGASDKNKKAKN